MAYQSANRRAGNEDAFELPIQYEQAQQVVRELMLEKARLMHVEKVAKQARSIAPTPAGEADAVHIVVRKPPLPPMPVPRFSGNVTEYHDFMTVFDQTVDADKAISDAQKLVYLKSFVDGEAKRLITDILVSDENYATARRLVARLSSTSASRSKW